MSPKQLQYFVFPGGLRRVRGYFCLTELSAIPTLVSYFDGHIDRKSKTLLSTQLCGPALYLWRGLSSSVTFAPNVHALRRSGQGRIYSAHPARAVNRGRGRPNTSPHFTNHFPPRGTRVSGIQLRWAHRLKVYVPTQLVRPRHGEQAAEAALTAHSFCRSAKARFASLANGS